VSDTMFYGPPLDVMPVLQNGVVDGKDVAPGLGFVGKDVFIDQHFLIRGRFARMLPAMLAKGYALGLGIDENTAVVVGPTRDATVIGYRGAIVLDLTDASTDRKQPNFNLSNARISYLDSGDRFNLASRSYFPGPDKERVMKRCPSTASRSSMRTSWGIPRSEEHTSELQSRSDLVCRLLLEKKKKQK